MVTDLNEETRRAWDANAEFWDQRMADGNDFQRELVGPATERLLQLEPGELVLEVACGNGVMARRLADLGARVVAFDFAEKMVVAAKARGDAEGAIDYRVVDATDENAVVALGEGQFDAAVCNMAIMDMADIDPLMSAVSRVLKPKGRLVFTLCHPCFNHTGCARVVEDTDEGGVVRRNWLKVFRYHGGRPTRGIAMAGQPELQIYFDRTLAQLFGACFRAGLVVTGLEEPVFDSSTPADWVHQGLFAEIPAVLAVRAEPGS